MIEDHLSISECGNVLKLWIKQCPPVEAFKNN